jgi:hypothetical protein
MLKMMSVLRNTQPNPSFFIFKHILQHFLINIVANVYNFFRNFIQILKCSLKHIIFKVAKNGKITRSDIRGTGWERMISKTTNNPVSKNFMQKS